MFDYVLAEKVTSLGKDWHRPCLKCAKCGKVLNSGGHAEVRYYYQILFYIAEPFFFVNTLVSAAFEAFESGL